MLFGQLVTYIHEHIHHTHLLIFSSPFIHHNWYFIYDEDDDDDDGNSYVAAIFAQLALARIIYIKFVIYWIKSDDESKQINPLNQLTT